jgi:hypothetical protein
MLLSAICHPELVEGSVQPQSWPREGLFCLHSLQQFTGFVYWRDQQPGLPLVPAYPGTRPVELCRPLQFDRLVYYEVYPTPSEAIAREKQLKNWGREKKKRLIQKQNPMWRNLLDDLKAGTVELMANEEKAG